jgi:hypothetical protein
VDEVVGMRIENLGEQSGRSWPRKFDLGSLLDDKSKPPTRNYIREFAQHEKVPRYLTDPCPRDAMLHVTDKADMKPFADLQHPYRLTIDLGKSKKDQPKEPDRPRPSAAWTVVAYLASAGTPLFFISLLCQRKHDNRRF